VRREKEQAMENNDRQQDGGNFGEAKEDVFVDLFAGEAVSEDSGHSDWGGGLLKLLAGETLVKGDRKCPRY
jgi:hypothetical protein